MKLLVALLVGTFFSTGAVADNDDFTEIYFCSGGAMYELEVVNVPQIELTLAVNVLSGTIGYITQGGQPVWSEVLNHADLVVLPRGTYTEASPFTIAGYRLWCEGDVLRKGMVSRMARSL